MDSRAHSWTLIGVVAICSTMAGMAVMDALTGQQFQTSLFAQTATATTPLVQSTVTRMPATPVVQMQSTAMPVQADEVMPLQSSGSQSTWSPVSALLAVPAAVAAIFFLVGRYARQSETIGLLDVEVAMAATTGEQSQNSVSRRTLLQTGAVVASMAATPAFAAIPNGFRLHKDPYDGYELIYPFGWQEVQVQGQDVLFKDLIEPLENIGVSIIPTEKTSVTELGDVQSVCYTFADKLLTSSNQTVTLLDTRAEEVDGVTYYTMEFIATSGYTRHVLAALAIINGKLFTCVTGSSEKRWKRMEKTLRTAIDSFTVFKVMKTTLPMAM